MSEKRYSVMILPRSKDGGILLQSLVDKSTTTMDGFGSFYQPKEEPLKTANLVMNDYFDTGAQLTEAARLRYLINKPSGMVHLKVTVYFANIAETLKLQRNMYWFQPNDIPYKEMHPATGKWLPLIINQSGLLTATVKINQPEDHTSGKVTEFTKYLNTGIEDHENS